MTIPIVDAENASPCPSVATPKSIYSTSNQRSLLLLFRQSGRRQTTRQPPPRRCGVVGALFSGFLLTRGRWGDASGAGAGGVAFVAGFVGFVEIDDAPAAAFGAAAGGLEVVAVEEFDGVADVGGEGLGFGVEGLEFFALGVGVLAAGFAGAEEAEESAEEAEGFAAGDGVEGGLDRGANAERSAQCVLRTRAMEWLNPAKVNRQRHGAKGRLGGMQKRL